MKQVFDLYADHRHAELNYALFLDLIGFSVSDLELLSALHATVEVAVANNAGT